MEFTKTQKFVIKYLMDRKNIWVSPTEIGKAYGKLKGKKGYHSSWASPICLKLVKMHSIERNEDGHYAYAIDI